MNVASEAALYDLIRERFGVGDYDDSGDVPWFKARNMEISKLRAQMKRRRVSIEDMVIAVWYADREKRPITAVWQLCQLVRDARKAYREFTTGPGLREQLNEAAAHAHEHGLDQWAERLYNADLSTGADVLAKYHEGMR